jgi:hypothetical protein
MPNTRLGIAQSQTLQARSCSNFLIEMTSKFRHHNVIVSDILDSDHLPIIFNILDDFRTTNVSSSLDKFTDWERF